MYVYTFYFSGTMIDIKECEAFPLKPEESQHLSQDGASAVSLTASVDLHMVTTSSEANEQVNFSVTEKVLSGEPENCQTVSPVEASNSGIHIAQQPSKHTEDTQQSTQFLHGCPTSEGSKDAVDADAAGQVLPQQCEETISEKNLTEVVDVPGKCFFLFFCVVFARALFFVYCRSVKTLPYLRFP